MLAWGSNASAQLGDGSLQQRNLPVNVCAKGATGACTVASGNVLGGVSAIGAAANSSYAVALDGSVFVWGNNANGQLGDRSQTRRTTPVNVVCRDSDATDSAFCSSSGFLRGVTAIAAGTNSPFALLTDGTVLGWGLNLADQIGDGTMTTRLTPVNVCAVEATAPCTVARNNVLTGVSKIARVSGGGFAITTVGDTSAVVAWGGNASGQLGDGTTISRMTPVYVCAVGATAPCSVANNNYLQGVSALVGGVGATHALLSDQSVLGWGTNGSGQLGDGTLTGHITPAQVIGLGSGSGVTAISAGNGVVVALKSDGAVLAWGADDLGQLGDGVTYSSSWTPAWVLSAF